MKKEIKIKIINGEIVTDVPPIFPGAKPRVEICPYIFNENKVQIYLPRKFLKGAPIIELPCLFLREENYETKTSYIKKSIYVIAYEGNMVELSSISSKLKPKPPKPVVPITPVCKEEFDKNIKKVLTNSLSHDHEFRYHNCIYSSPYHYLMKFLSWKDRCNIEACDFNKYIDYMKSEIIRIRIEKKERYIASLTNKIQ